MSGKKDNSEQAGFGRFASARIVLGIIIAMGCLWVASMAFTFFTKNSENKSKFDEVAEQYPAVKSADEKIRDFMSSKSVEGEKLPPDVSIEKSGMMSHEAGGVNPELLGGNAEGEHGHEAVAESREAAPAESHEAAASESHGEAAKSGESKKSGAEDAERFASRKIIGVSFVDAMCNPLEYELEKRLWGWRPNDIVKYGLDNVMNYQLGIREVVRRSADILADRISRTGSNEAINKYLNDAVNSLTVDPKSYWWPSAESEYKRAIRDLRAYKEQVIRGEARFHTRPDNLIPLLVEFSTRLGDCDDKLVEPGISMFESDDRFYYSKGVATEILAILEAVQYDFYMTLKTRDGIEPLNRAIEDCKEAAELSPWFIIDGDYDGFFANHRANMGAYISHARFYINVLITTLST
jgi:hypothetical protein